VHHAVVFYYFQSRTQGFGMSDTSQFHKISIKRWSHREPTQTISGFSGWHEPNTPNLYAKYTI